MKKNKTRGKSMKWYFIISDSISFRKKKNIVKLYYVFKIKGKKIVVTEKTIFVSKTLNPKS